MGIVIQEALGRSVPRCQAGAPGSRRDGAGERADIARHAVAEELVEQIGGGTAVGVEEQKPLAMGALRAGVAGMRRGALPVGPDEQDPIGGQRGARVVGQDELILGPDGQPGQRPQGEGGVRAGAGERHHDADPGTAGSGPRRGHDSPRTGRGYDRRACASSDRV